MEFNNGLFGLAILFSVFYAMRAVVVNPEPYDGNHKTTALILNAIYTFIFHALGSFIGWLLIYYLAVRIKCLYPNLNQLKLSDVMLLLFGFLGVTGHLPQTLYGFVVSFGKLAESISNKIAK